MQQRRIRQTYQPGGFMPREPEHVARMLIPPGSWEGTDPFLVLVEDKFRAPSGFPDHPHRGIETVTLVLDGHLRHADNRGNSGVLVEGDVQWMTAGRGIIHAELPWQDYPAHTLQLWLNLPSKEKMMAPGYQDLGYMDRVSVHDDGVDVHVISGSMDGVNASTRNIVPVSYLDVRVAAGKTAVLPIPAAHNGFVHVIEGSILVGPELTPGQRGDVLWLDYPTTDAGTSTLSLQAQADARFLVVTGLPVREKVVAQGPFVMNSSEEILRAYADYRKGSFGGPTPAALEFQEADEEMFERLSKAKNV